MKKEKRKIKKNTWVIGSQAMCEDCDWCNGSQHNSQGTGAIHASAFGHKVVVETVLCSEYNGRAGG